MSVVDFSPSVSAVFSFQPTFGGTPYTISVPWNVFGQRFYINVTDLAGNLILHRALSPTGPTLNAAFTWAAGTATATTTVPHAVPVGSVAAVTVSKTSSPFDGDARALSTSPTTLTYPLMGNPPAAVGVVNFPLNLIAGYLPGSLMFHEDTQQFEF